MVQSMDTYVLSLLLPELILLKSQFVRLRDLQVGFLKQYDPRLTLNLKTTFP